MSDDPSTPPPAPTSHGPRPSAYYRGILRWRVRPTFVILLLALWGWGIHHGYLYEPAATWDSSTVETSLHYLDRELRLAEALEEHPPALRWFLLEESRNDTLTASIESLNTLHAATSLGASGRFARDVLRRELDPTAELQNPPLIDAFNEAEISNLQSLLESGGATWWDHQAIEKSAADLPPAIATLGKQQDRQFNQAILTRAIVANTLSWGVFAAGLFCIPAACRTIRTGMRRPLPVARRYGWTWPATLILALFVITDWIGGWWMSLAYRFVPTSLFSFGFEVFVDFTWRFLPIALLLFILFRRPSHAIRSFGLNQRPDWKLILGVFSILGLIDLGLYQLMEPTIAPDPTGGLDAMEFGWPGLFYGLLSACIAAPVAEELLYRGTLLRGIASARGFWVAALVSTLAFILCHYYDLYGSISVGIFGLSAAIVYRATGSLTHAIALHALYNFSITTFIWLIYHAPL